MIILRVDGKLYYIFIQTLMGVKELNNPSDDLINSNVQISVLRGDFFSAPSRNYRFWKPPSIEHLPESKTKTNKSISERWNQRVV